MNFNEQKLKENLRNLGLTYNVINSVLPSLSLDLILNINANNWRYFEKTIPKKFDIHFLNPQYLTDYFKLYLQKQKDEIVNFRNQELEKQNNELMSKALVEQNRKKINQELEQIDNLRKEEVKTLKDAHKYYGEKKLKELLNQELLTGLVNKNSINL